MIVRADLLLSIAEQYSNDNEYADQWKQFLLLEKAIHPERWADISELDKPIVLDYVQAKDNSVANFEAAINWFKQNGAEKRIIHHDLKAFIVERGYEEEITWSLPGGMDEGNGATATLLAELEEETGLKLPKDAFNTSICLGKRLVKDFRTTENAVVGTTPNALKIDSELEPKGDDDAAIAMFLNPKDVNINEAHKGLLADALKALPGLVAVKV